MSTFSVKSNLTTPWDVINGTAALRVEDYPSALLMRTANLIQSKTTAIYAKANNLSIPEWRLLARLHESAPMQLADLCKTSYFDKAYAGRILRSMQKKGLIDSKIDDKHKRRRVINLTCEGRRLAIQVEKNAQDSQKKILNYMSDDERNVLYFLLQKLIKDMNEIELLKGN